MSDANAMITCSAIWPQSSTYFARHCLTLLLTLLVPLQVGVASTEDKGKALYDYWCYQCHGYAGDGRTLSSVFLSPPPRNFTAYTPEQLDRATMISAVERGRDGTGMVAFSSVLASEEIAQVVDFIRREFMRNNPSVRAYHSVENGWKDHDRYEAAYPFVLGSIELELGFSELTEAQLRGRSLYMSDCISCHDRPLGSEMTTVQWISSEAEPSNTSAGR